MSKQIHINQLPKTPDGQHYQLNAIDADSVCIDSEISIKPSLLRQCVSGNPWFEGEENENYEPKILARKSMDLRKIKSAKEKVEAILSSPMVDSRPRRLSQVKSTDPSANSTAVTPLRLPQYNDLVSSTSRRLSRIILNKRSSLFADQGSNSFSNQNIDSQTSKENMPPSMVEVPTDAKGDMSNDAIVTEPNSLSDFRILCNSEILRLQALCGDWNGVISEESDKIPDLALDSIRAAIGKCRLLLSKKIPFFTNLIDTVEQNQMNTNDSIPRAGINDLMGYWSTVANEISRIDSSFERLRIWRDNFCWLVDHRPITPARSALPIVTSKPSKLPRRVNRKSLKKSTENEGRQINVTNSKQNKNLLPTKSRFAQFMEARRHTVISNELNLTTGP